MTAPRLSLLGRLLITCFGLGYLRPAPGTWGSLPPVVITLMMVTALSSHSAPVANAIFVNAALVIVALGFSWVCLRYGAAAESHFAKKDPGSAVADEVAGQCVSLLFLPWQWTDDVHGVQANLSLAAMSFVVFRILDILKPPPAHRLQSLPGGAGIVVDDLVVGVYAAIIVHVAAAFLVNNRAF
jgi:phosphatidylglycerophosphatase A